MAVELAVLSLLIAWLHSLMSNIPLRSPKAIAYTPPNPLVHSTWIPFLGHIIGIANKGVNVYVSSLCANQRSSIATLKLPGQDIHLIHPQDSASIKQFTSMRSLSLMAVFRAALGPAMGLVPASEKFLTDSDAGVFKRDLSKLFNGELRNLQNLQKHASQLEQKMDHYWAETFTGRDPAIKVGLGGWLFDVLSRSMGAVFWGEEGPFEDRLFRDYLRLFIQNLESLRNPITWLIPSELCLAREYVRKKIDESAQNEAYGTLFARLARLYESLNIPREGFADCHLVATVGLMSNVINMISWAVCHIVADSELMACVLAEIKDVVDDSSSPYPTIDVDRIRSCCPLLVATWYELLRIYADSPVARRVQEDSLWGNKYHLRKGSIIMTPIHLHNFDQTIWGDDAEAFRPRRFLHKYGKVDQELVKHLNVFGLPGMHQCPGRYLGLTMTLAVLAKTLLSFDITPEPGDALAGGTVPSKKDTMLGLPALSRDPDVNVTRREGIKKVDVIFDNVRSGW